eukprot:jgi/Hompol1/143/HPOL_002452-RA
MADRLKDIRMDRSTATTGSSSSVASTTSSANNSRHRRDILELKNEIGYKYIIFMVGLPARGKSYICKKLSRYLSWCGFNTKVFNVGNRRRIMNSASPPMGPSTAPSIASETSSAETSLGISADSPPKKQLASSGLDRIDETMQSGPSKLPPTVGILPLRTAPQHTLPSPVVHATSGIAVHDAKFFDASNEDAKAIRERLAAETLEELISWLKKGGKVAIHDATNTTVERRRSLLERVEKEHGIRAFFIESICPDLKILEENIKMKLNGPDYYLMDPEEAIRDFRIRIANYEKVYEPISEEEESRNVSYIKIINVGQKVIANGIHGYLPSQCVFYLMQMHIKQRTIWLTRHGESEFNPTNRIGGDPPLTPLGQRYSLALANFMKKLHPPRPVSTVRLGDGSETPTHTSSLTDPGISRAIADIAAHSAQGNSDNSKNEHSLPVGAASSLLTNDRSYPLTIYTSTLRRTMDASEHFDPDEYEVNHVRFLNEIYAGTMEGMTYAEVEQTYPEEFAARQRNKLLYRYPGPGGESYIDVIERLRPVIIELERMQSDVLVVTHQVIMRTLLAYFMGISLHEMPNITVPLHTVYCLKPQPYGTDLTRYTWNQETDEFEVAGEGWEIRETDKSSKAAK